MHLHIFEFIWSLKLIQCPLTELVLVIVLLDICWVLFASFVLVSNQWIATTPERKWNSIWNSFTQLEFSSPQVLVTVLHITVIAEPHQLWLLNKFCHLSFPLFCAYPNMPIICEVVFCCLFYLHTYSMYTSLNTLHSLLGEVSTHKHTFREGQTFFLYSLSHSVQLCFVGGNKCSMGKKRQCLQWLGVVWPSSQK